MLPESRYLVEVNYTLIKVWDHSGRLSKINISQVSEVYVETNDSGPWGMDVWFVLVDLDGEDRCAFPLGASNQDAALDLLKRLNGFEMRGMNSIENKRHLCWRRKSD